MCRLKIPITCIFAVGWILFLGWWDEKPWYESVFFSFPDFLCTCLGFFSASSVSAQPLRLSCLRQNILNCRDSPRHRWQLCRSLSVLGCVKSKGFKQKVCVFNVRTVVKHESGELTEQNWITWVLWTSRCYRGKINCLKHKHSFHGHLLSKVVQILTWTYCKTILTSKVRFPVGYFFWFEHPKEAPKKFFSVDHTHSGQNPWRKMAAVLTRLTSLEAASMYSGPCSEQANL